MDFTASVSIASKAPESVGILLRRHRLAARLTQAELAERAGLSSRTVGNIENVVERGADYMPYLSTLGLLADALALDAEDRAALLAAAQRPPTAPLPAGESHGGSSPIASPLAQALPVPPNRLIGREREVCAVAALLQRGDVRLVTLVGPPGVGKTHLGIEVARSLRERFPDGVGFVSLAPLAVPTRVLLAIARALGIKSADERGLLEEVVATLGARRLLLVLDNFEHLLAGAPVVAELLACCEGLTLLATSRAPLRVRGEQEFVITPLALPPTPPHLPPVERLARVASLQLFVERARSVLPSFALTPSNAADVAAICHRLDGLPLALELAATRVRLFSPRTLLERLEQRLPLLIDGARDLPPRQRTLRSAIAWSYSLLTQAEQIIFRRLAVFAGGCSLEAAEALCQAPLPTEANDHDDYSPHATGGPPPSEDIEHHILAHLEVLLAHHLVLLDDLPDGARRPRLLETLREFGREQLVACHELDATRRPHATYFRDLALQADEHLRGPDQAIWLARLEADAENLRAALAWACEAEDAVIGWQLGTALTQYWYICGQAREGLAWCEALLAIPSADDDETLVCRRARLLSCAGHLAHRLGSYPRAVALLEESLAIRRRFHDRQGIAAVLSNLALVRRDQGGTFHAAALWRESIALADAAGDRWQMAVGLGNLATLFFTRGRYRPARRLYESALSLARELGDLHMVADMLGNLGEVACEQGDYERALDLFDESMSLQGPLGDRRHHGITLMNLGIIARRRGDPPRAERLLEASIMALGELGEKRFRAYAQIELAHVRRDKGRAREARALVEEAQGALGQLHDPLGRAYALLARGWLTLDEEQYQLATSLFIEGFQQLRKGSSSAGVPGCLEALAIVAQRQGNPARTLRLYAVAAHLRQTMGAPIPPSERPEVEAALARARTAMGDAASSAVQEASPRPSPNQIAVLLAEMERNGGEQNAASG